MSKNRQYDQEYKLQAVKLAKEIGGGKAARELGISSNTLYGWMRKERTGHLAQQGAVSPDAAISLVDENEALRKQVRQLTKEIKRINELNEFLEEASAFFRRQPSEVGKNERMKFIAIKTSDGKITGKIAFYCRCLNVSRQGFYSYLGNKNKPWKYQAIADDIVEILNEDSYNDTYGRERIWLALQIKHPEKEIPSLRTIYRIMQHMGIVTNTKRKPNGITKADKLAQKSDDLIRRDFKSDEPMKKCVTDMTEIKGKDGKLYVSAIFDCFDAGALGLAMANNMKAELCVRTLDNAVSNFPELAGAIIHSDRGSQYTSKEYREAVSRYGIQQSMNSAGGRCHDNARCESMWARMKSEVFYGRMKSTSYTIEELKTIIWRYYMSYWNNRRIFPGNGGYPPMVKRQKYYADKCM